MSSGTTGNTQLQNPPAQPLLTALSGQHGMPMNAGGTATTGGATSTTIGFKAAMSNSGNPTTSTSSNTITFTLGIITPPEHLITDPSWPSELVLDLEKGNWFE